MYAYIIRRLWQMIPTILGVIVLVFILFNWVSFWNVVDCGSMQSRSA